jgi:hypothetical protein
MVQKSTVTVYKQERYSLGNHLVLQQFINRDEAPMQMWFPNRTLPQEVAHLNPMFRQVLGWTSKEVHSKVKSIYFILS